MTRRACAQRALGGAAALLAGPSVAGAAIPDAVAGESGRLSDLVPIVRLRDSVADAAAVAGGEKQLRRTDAERMVKLLSDPVLGDKKAFNRLFDAYSDRVSAKTRAMNNAAFITYYEEARYGDTRLEDKEPTKQALQYSFRNASFVAIDSLRAELSFLLSEAATDGEGALDAGDVRKYAKEAVDALDSYLDLAPKEDVARARSGGSN